MKEANVEKQILSMIDFRAFRNNLDELDPKDYVSAVLRLMEFVVPKKAAVAQEITNKTADAAQLLIQKMAGMVSEN